MFLETEIRFSIVEPRSPRTECNRGPGVSLPKQSRPTAAGEKLEADWLGAQCGNETKT